ncbi:hypothetical protein [Cyanobacterium sp. Dongsha4]|uniref:hypothetical protein n=1 Tax=Cyanobacterium sp. DS4 TaxID=2878255 RepID=UPI002E7FBB7D|nr:hypothetical protein [Cyanobacterium sp. Dongsha4]WVL00227.1 hypothetical protein Dongsha4_16475 [Cyanobacterium sp. Dongsha4]
MLVSEEITIQVTPQVAKAYQLATEKEKQRLSAIASLFFDEEAKEDIDFLGRIMDEISDRAVARGLTPEILADILND